MDTVGKVSRLTIETRLHIDQLVNAYDPEGIVRITVGQMTTGFIEEAHALAVEVALNDLQLEVHREWENRTIASGEQKFLEVYHYRARWAPATKTIEMVGGPADGQLWDVPTVGDPFQWATPLPLSELMGPAIDPMEILTYRVFYTLSGWHEESRHWVYTLQEEK
jgi:hypothetical protein